MNIARLVIRSIRTIPNFFPRSIWTILNFFPEVMRKIPNFFTRSIRNIQTIPNFFLEFRTDFRNICGKNMKIHQNLLFIHENIFFLIRKSQITPNSIFQANIRNLLLRVSPPIKISSSSWMKKRKITRTVSNLTDWYTSLAILWCSNFGIQVY